MPDDAVTTLCAILLRRRMVPDKELRAFARTPGLEDEVRERLAMVGFLLARQPGVPSPTMAFCRTRPISRLTIDPRLPSS